jgi:hypothetical protein
LQIAVPTKKTLGSGTIFPQNPFKTLQKPLKNKAPKTQEHGRNNLHPKTFKILKKFH